MKHLKQQDSAVYNAIVQELSRQRNNLELIASENIVSQSVLECCGSILTNKYAEGYPSKRYYGGCQYIDIIEQLAIDRAKQLFGADHANVQPHSGANANTAVFLAVLQPGDTIMGMALAHGGHLTHGSKVNISGKYFRTAVYGVNSDGYIDYDEVREIALQNKPKLIIAGASAYSRIIDWQKFRTIADEVGAYLMVDMAHIAGLVAVGLHPNPVPYADFVTSTTHKTLRGPRGGLILCKQQYQAIIDKALFPGSQGGPLQHIIAGKAVALKEAMSPQFKQYITAVVENCKQLEITLKQHNIKLVSGGTDNHLLLLDLTGTDITGAQLNDLLEQCNITVNKNAVPFDPLPPNITSGIRIGTAVVTSRGMGKEDMITIANMIADIIVNKQSAVQRVRQQTKVLCDKYPIYTQLDE